MQKIISEIQKSRYALLFLCGILYLSTATILRIVLLVSSWNSAHGTIMDIGQIFLIGFLYDLVFYVYVSIIFSLILLFLPRVIYESKVYKYITFLSVFLFVCGAYFVLTAEWLYWDEFNARFNFIAIDYLMYSYEVTHNIHESYPIGWIFFGILSASVATFTLIKRPIVSILRVREDLPGRLKYASIIIALSLCSYFFIGQTARGLSNNNYINELGSNGPYQFFAAFRNNTLDYKTFYTQGDEKKLSRLLKETVGKNPDDGNNFDIVRKINPANAHQDLNVILISIESMSADFLSVFGQKENITPFMDQWFHEGMLFTNFYATGTRTTRGLESITLSIPPTPGRSLVKRPDNARIYNIGKVFKDNGYDVAFLYGGRGFFDNMNAFYSGNGYRIVDQTDLGDEEITFKNVWGVSDEDLYKRAIVEANKAYTAGNHFFFHIMTTSNHRPFTYPEGKIDIPSGSGRSGAVKYTDYALQQLIALSKKQNWFDDTVFVIVADHCARSAGRAELPVEKYHIPLFVYAPKHIEPGIVAKLSGQIDLAPTLLSLLGFEYQSHFFGQDILSDTFQEKALIGNYQRLGLFENNELAILSPVKQIHVIKDPLQSR
jgi:phosphoglycerol transferase MdoB-like AlkP superfamily enzyme